MSVSKMIKVAITLSAYDKMSRQVYEATSKSEKALMHLRSVAKESLSTGLGFAGGGAGMAATIKPVIDAYSSLEDASLRLKSVMLRDGNQINEKMFKAVNSEAIRLGNKLPGTTADFQNLFATMLETGVQAESILNGSGNAAAYLAVQMELGTEEAGKLAGKLQNAMSIPDKDMLQWMDFMARMKNVNVEAVEMQYAFAKASMPMKMLGIQGLEAGKLVGNFFAQAISTGQSGETIGTNFGRILMSIANPTKYKKFQEAAKAYGVSIEMFDKKGRFKGIENLMTTFFQFQGMDPLKINEILAPLSGGEGVDSGLLNMLSMNGAEMLNGMNKRIWEQAYYLDKVNLRLESFRNMWEATKGTYENFLASVGQSFAPEMKKVVDWMGRASAAMYNFSENHQGLFKISTGLFIIAGSLITLGGAIKIAQGLWVLMKFAAMTSIESIGFSLFALRFHIMTGIVPAITSAIASFRLWAAVNWALMPSFSSIIAASWAFTASLMANPITWIVLAVVALGAAFVIAYKKSETFRAVIAGILNIGKALLDVFVGLGKVAIGTFTMDMNMIKEGAKQSALAMAKVMNPVGLMNTFKEGYDKSLASEKSANSAPIPNKPNLLPNATSSTNNITFAPVVNLNGSATAEDGKALNNSMKGEFEKLMKQWNSKQKRTSFS